MDIRLDQILKIENTDTYKLHLACSNGYEHPLDVYLRSWDEWVGWNKWKGTKNDFSRDFIFSLIEYYPESNKWLFGGIFQVIKRHKDYYHLELMDIHKEYIGRLILNFHRYKGLRGRAYYLESYYNDFTVSEILKEKYDGIEFPGYEYINIDFNSLKQIYSIEKRDWKTALENIKGVYVIFDKSKAKKYVGSAYGDIGIWSRWAVYIGTGHGWNDELTKLINKKGYKYATENFVFTLLEYRSMKTDDSIIIHRESYWKECLLSRGDYGYNKN
jgi:hypothetical protein